jgi:Ca2+-binding RTX toxin-like protein
VVTEAAGEGTDTVQTTLATYTLGANLENLTFTGTGNFAGTGNAEANVITGGTGNDTLDGAGGVDTLVGGAGNDTYILDNPGDVVTEGASAGTDTVQTALAAYTLGANLENLTYTGTGNFAGTGNAEANVITGGAGNDTLDGAAGADTLIGGAGDDIYFVDDAGDTLTEAAAGGTDTVETTLATYTLGAELENLTYIGTGNFTGTGNAENNIITGSVGNDSLLGAGGNDTLIGGLGDDNYLVSEAGDVVTEASGEGTDTVVTTLATYTLGSNLENLTYIGTGNFAGIGNTLNNIITGSVGNDSLLGAGGNDTMIGGLGDDNYLVSEAGDVVTEASGEGTDTVETTLASYTLGANLENLTYTGPAAFFAGTGNAADNVITGGDVGPNLLSGEGGDDTLNGGTNSDVLVGGSGNDLLNGGLGDDFFIFNSLVGMDTVQDFGTGADKLSIDMSDIAIGNANTTIDNGVTISGAALWNGDNEIVVVTDDLNSLSAADVASYMSAASDGSTAGDTVIFVVNDGTDSAIYRYTSTGGSTVSTSDLHQLALIEGTDALALGDFAFIA